MSDPQDPDDPSWVVPDGVSDATAERLVRWHASGRVRICGYPRCTRPAIWDGHCAEGHQFVKYSRGS